MVRTNTLYWYKILCILWKKREREMKNFNWNRDKICDVGLILRTANHLWYKQCFTQPTIQTTEEIIELLSKANLELETIIVELEEII